MYKDDGYVYSYIWPKIYSLGDTSPNKEEETMKQFYVKGTASTYETYDEAEKAAKKYTQQYQKETGIFQLVAKTEEIVPDIKVTKISA